METGVMLENDELMILATDTAVSCGKGLENRS